MLDIETQGATMRRLEAFDAVAISPPPEAVSPRVGQMRFDVIALVGRTAALEPRDPEQLAWLPRTLSETMMAFEHEGALVALKGALVREDAGYVRFAVGDGVLLDRRSATRATVTVPIALERPADGARGEGMTLDVSMEGVLAAATLDATVGDVVVASVQLPDAPEPLTVDGIVVRTSGGTLAVQLTGAKPADRERLDWVVTAHNRALILRRREAAERSRGDG